MEHRIQVCPTFADVCLDHTAAQTELPENGVPQAFIDHAVEAPETADIHTVMEGPASRHSQDAPNPTGDKDMSDSDDAAPNEHACAPCSSAPTAPLPQAEETNKFETIIGMDTQSGPKPVQLFQAMQAKMDLLQGEAAKIAKATNNAKDDIPNTAAVGGEEHCRRIAVDLQDIMKKLAKPGASAVLDDIARAADACHTNVTEALAVPTGKPMSTFHPSTYPACFTEWFYGDGCPFLDRPVRLSCSEVFQALASREELEYQLPSDTERYVASLLGMCVPDQSFPLSPPLLPVPLLLSFPSFLLNLFPMPVPARSRPFPFLHQGRQPISVRHPGDVRIIRRHPATLEDFANGQSRL